MEIIRMIVLALLFINISTLIYFMLARVDIISITNNDNAKIRQEANTVANKKYTSVSYYKQKFSLIEKIEKKIIESNIRKFVPWFSSKFVIGISVLIGGIIFYSSYVLLNNVITSTVLFVICAFIPIYLLEMVSSYTDYKIERNFIYFLNILMNFAQLKDDVYYAFEKTVGYIEEPLNGYTKTFLEEVKRGLPVEEALDNFKSKISNNKFKLFLDNAQLCVRYGGSFLSLTSNNLDTMKQLQMEKARRKSETSLGRILIYVMMGINIALAVYMFGMYPNTLEIIRNDFYGQVVVLINTLNLFIVFYLSLKLQKIDY